MLEKKIGEKIGGHCELTSTSAFRRSHIFWLLQKATFWLMLFIKVLFELVTKHLLFLKKHFFALKITKVLLKATPNTPLDSNVLRNELTSELKMN